ncbi:hypothetical protein BCV70DRAFT_202065 [Testicularia cyperi]|uniref:Transmembrane protein n=1 Tax=Testicularia cyperi TaxID=1882483 RepID=A0A317XLM0_9BASI|nr:hypothetical protein BCV70DRAFT_202065 [Testicularia cyperi]
MSISRTSQPRVTRDGSHPTSSQSERGRALKTRKNRRAGKGCRLVTGQGSRPHAAWLSTVVLLLICLGIVSSSSARVIGLNPIDVPFSDAQLQSRSPRDEPILPRQGYRHLHLCKCTCFQTNSTLVPLYSPIDPAKPCNTCTRQFCLDQGLDICKDAKLEHTDHDVGTGFEGDVWAKCFERESGKDQTIITLYLLVVVGLIVFALMRRRMEGWYQTYQSTGPQGLYHAVRQAPWRR